MHNWPYRITTGKTHRRAKVHNQQCTFAAKFLPDMHNHAYDARPAMLLFNFFSNYVGCACMHVRQYIILGLLIFPWTYRTSLLPKLPLFAHHQGFELRFLQIWTKLPIKSIISPKQGDYEYRGAKTVKLLNKMKRKNGIELENWRCKTAKIEVYHAR